MQKKILIVDDSESIREFLKYTIESEGYEVLVGIDGVDAMKYFKNYDTKLTMVLTDLHMPNMDGIGLIKEIRKLEKFKHLPILFLTTESGIRQKMEAKKAGATGWIIKPVTAEKIISIINRCLR